MSNLLTARELAPLVGLTAQTVCRWKTRGIIPAAVNDPNCVRYDLAPVKAALAARSLSNSRTDPGNALSGALGRCRRVGPNF